MREITIDEVRKYLEPIQGREIDIDKVRADLGITREAKSWDGLRVILFRLAKEKVVKPSGKRDGIYKVIVPINPVNWWADNGKEEALGFRFPRSYDDGVEVSSFGIEELVEVFAGDMILVTGRSNYGKTTIALSIMGENLDLMPANLMGSEYTAADGKISPKFRRRMKRMKWVEWMKDGKPRFQLLPVGSDYEDYVVADCINVIDWISLSGEYYLIDTVMKAIKDRIGNGIAVVVLQKNKDQEFGEGGERTQRYADVELRIDAFGDNESLLTIGKVKSPKGRATGRMWAFSVVDWGANLHNIREMVKCHTCWGKGYVRSGSNSVRCSSCNGKKYTEKT